MVSLTEAEIEDLESQLQAGQLVEDLVIGVTCGGCADIVCDATVEEDESFVADGLVVHNSNICRFLHGKTFSVGDAVRRFERIESLEQPEDIKTEQPWVRESRDPETGRTVLYVNKGSRRVPITEVVRSGLGAKDDTGEFRRSTGDQALMDLGVSFPPYHGLCRTSMSGIT